MLDKLLDWLPNRPRLDRGGIVDGELEPHRDEEILDDYDGQRVNTGMPDVPKDWVRREFHPYDANRYDPEKRNDECLVCGTEFEGRHTRSGGQKWCPECEVTVRLID